MSGDYEIDTELLISLVQEHPVLWDKTVEDYKNKNLTAATWRAICVVLVEKYESADEKDQAEICKSIQKKWTNLRDAWMKNCKKEKDFKKSGSGAKSSRKYIYHNQMLFLQKVTDMRNTQSSLMSEDISATTENEEGDGNIETEETNLRKKVNVSQSCLPPSKTSFGASNFAKKKKMDSFEEEIIKELKQKPEENRHMSFFKGILPSINLFTEDQTMDFQIGVLSLIKVIKKGFTPQINIPPNGSFLTVPEFSRHDSSCGNLNPPRFYPNNNSSPGTSDRSDLQYIQSPPSEYGSHSGMSITSEWIKPEQ